MRRWLLIILAMLPFLALAPKVSAHFPATSGPISAELHIEPGDAPVAGQAQILYLIISDAINRFSMAGCACELSISKDGQGIYYTSLSPPAAGKATIYSTAGVPYTFSTAGNYHVVVTGQPLEPGTFQPFDLNWSLQVPQAPESGSSFSTTTFLKYFAAILAVFLLVGAAVFILS